MPMKLDAHIENMYSMSSDLKMSTMKSEAGRPVSPACTLGSAVVAVCAPATDVCCAISAAAAPVAAPVRKLRRSTPAFFGSSMCRYPITALARCQFSVLRRRGNRETKGGASRGRVRGRDLAAVGGDDAARYRQPESQAVRARGVERLEQPRQRFRWDPGAGIGHGNLDSIGR